MESTEIIIGKETEDSEKGGEQRKETRGRGGVIFMFVVVYLISAGVLAYGAYQYGLFKGKQGDSDQLLVNSNQEITVRNQETDNNQPTGVPTTDYGLQPTVNKQQPTTSNQQPTTTATGSNLTSYQNQLPAGWQLVQATDASFEMGFDPNKYTADVGEKAGSIFIEPKDGGSFRSVVTLKTYDGGSRHRFIFGTQPVTKGDTPEKYSEKEFTYEGKNCLFLENVVISMGPTVYGMCDAGEGKAFWVNTWEKEYLKIVRSLKRLR